MTHEAAEPDAPPAAAPPAGPGEAAPRRPDFLIIGGAKCATRWLCRGLTQHPGVYVPIDEVHQFSRHYNPRDPLPADYLALFQDQDPNVLCGENSNTYFAHRLCPQRIASVLPGAKLMVCLRNPIDRAYSDYCMQVRYGLADAEIERYLDPDFALTNTLLETGLYHELLQRFLVHYPHDRLHVSIYDDMGDPTLFFSRIWRFLGVDDGFMPRGLDERVNTSGRAVVLPRLKRRLLASPMTRWLVDAVRHGGGRGVVEKLAGRSMRYEPLTDALRGKLAEYYRDDTARLSEMLGRDLAGLWLARGRAEDQAEAASGLRDDT